MPSFPTLHLQKITKIEVRCLVGVDPLEQLVAEGFAVIVVGNGEIVGILRISLLHAQVMPLHVELFQGNRKCVCTFTVYKVLSVISVLLLKGIFIQPPKLMTNVILVLFILYIFLLKLKFHISLQKYFNL